MLFDIRESVSVYFFVQKEVYPLLEETKKVVNLLCLVVRPDKLVVVE